MTENMLIMLCATLVRALLSHVLKWVDQSKKAEVRILQILLYRSPIPLIFAV